MFCLTNRQDDRTAMWTSDGKPMAPLLFNAFDDAVIYIETVVLPGYNEQDLDGGEDWEIDEVGDLADLVKEHGGLWTWMAPGIYAYHDGMHKVSRN